MSETVLANLKPGDHCWMLNGVRSRSFLCEVSSLSHLGVMTVITVKNLDKDGLLFDFRAHDGRPTGDYTAFGQLTPTLVLYDDPDAIRLDVDRVHREYRVKINELVAKLPVESLFDELCTTVDEWRTVVERTDG